jgi:hypothetical protein
MLNEPKNSVLFFDLPPLSIFPELLAVTIPYGTENCQDKYYKSYNGAKLKFDVAIE